MKITFYGTGSAFNHIHGNNAALLEFNDTNLLLDCGHTVPKFLEEGIKIANVNNIWISHIHGDHIGGLEEIAFRNRYLNKGKKANLIIPAGIEKRLRQYLDAVLRFSNEGEDQLEDYFNVCVVNKTFSIKGIEFKIEEVQHIAGAKSYMLIGPNFIFTGDTKFINWAEYDLSDINYIFQDTQLNKYGNDVHTTLPDLIKLPRKIREKIYCMHYGDGIDKFNDELKDEGFQIVKSFNSIELN